MYFLYGQLIYYNSINLTGSDIRGIDDKIAPKVMAIIFIFCVQAFCVISEAIYFINKREDYS